MSRKVCGCGLVLRDRERKAQLRTGILNLGGVNKSGALTDFNKVGKFSLRHVHLQLPAFYPTRDQATF